MRGTACLTAQLRSSFPRAPSTLGLRSRLPSPRLCRCGTYLPASRPPAGHSSVRAHGHLVAGSRRGDPRLRNGERGCGGFRRARWFPSTVRGPAVAEFRETCLHSERPRCGLLSYLTNLFSNCIVSERCPLPSPCSSNPMTCAWRCRRCAGHCSNDCVPPPRQPPSSRPSSRSVVSASITTCVPSREPA